jgi:hypothetical protein
LAMSSQSNGVKNWNSGIFGSGICPTHCTRSAALPYRTLAAATSQ